MKGIILGLILMFFFGGFVDAKAQKIETAGVQINHERRFAASRINIRFLELVEDSRCPIDTNCVWAGNARIKIQIRRNGSRPRIIELNSNLPERSAIFEGYKIEFTGLTPRPRSNIRIDRNGYVAAFSVSKIRK